MIFAENLPNLGFRHQEKNRKNQQENIGILEKSKLGE
jgi:hypothetical protein